MRRETIVAVRAYVAFDEGATGDRHWVEGTIASPRGRYPEYAVRGDWGIRRLGSVVAEVETSDGTIGQGQVSVSGRPAAWMIERYLAQFVIGRQVTAVQQISDVRHHAIVHFGGRGTTLNAMRGYRPCSMGCLGQAAPRISARNAWRTRA